MLRKKIDGFVLLNLRNISLQTMDGRRQVGGAAGGFPSRLMQFVLNCGITFMAYLIDIPNDGACFFTCLEHYALYCEHHSLPKPPMLTSDRHEIRNLLCDFLLTNRDSIMIADGVNQTTVHQYFVENYGLDAVDRKAVHFSNTTHDVVFCNNFEHYIDVMRFPKAHADELFVWAASRMFNIRLSLLEKFVSRIENPNLNALVEMGYPRTAAEHALQQCSGNLPNTIDFLLQNPTLSSESHVVWREDVHNQPGAFEVRIVRTGRHFQLVLPQYVPRELEPKLPPRTRKHIVDAQMMWEEQQRSSGCGGGAAAVPAPATPSRRKPSAGGVAAAVPAQATPSRMKPSAGGSAAVPAPATPSCRIPSAGGGCAAAVPHHPPPSFGHAQRQVVAGPQSWKDKLQGFFPSLVICHLVKNILMPSAEYAPSDDDIRKKAILLSSIAFAAKKKWEAVSSAFLFWAPNITFDEFKTVHSVVASFQIGAQAFRCTAVVFNDEHVVASPELKNLNKSNPYRESTRKEFYREIESYFQQNPRVVIDKMLLEPCV